MVVDKCDTRHRFVSLSFYPFVKNYVEFLISILLITNWKICKFSLSLPRYSPNSLLWGVA